MNNFKKPKQGMAISAFAGPASNILLAVIFLFVMGLVSAQLAQMGNAGIYFLKLLYTTAYINCVLAVFNIIPIPPLDGSKILFSLLPEREYYKLMQYERFGMIILVIIILSGGISAYLTTAVSWVFNILAPVTQWTASLLV